MDDRFENAISSRKRSFAIKRSPRSCGRGRYCLPNQPATLLVSERVGRIESGGAPSGTDQSTERGYGKQYGYSYVAE